MFERRSLHLAAGVVLLAAAAWLVLESVLRGMPLSFAPVLWPVLPAAILGCFVGIGVRPRASARGEFSASGELLSLSGVAGGLPMGLMAVGWTLGFLLSLLTVALLWVLLGLGVVLAVVLQVLVYAVLVVPPILLGIAFAEEEAKAGFTAWAVSEVLCVCLVAFVGTVLGIGLGGMVDGTMIVATWALRAHIPAWLFLFELVREAFFWLDHQRLITLVMTSGAALGAGLAGALGARWARTLLMGSARLRPYLPGGAAPSPNDAPLVPVRSVLPTLGWLSVAWMGVLVWVLL